MCPLDNLILSHKLKRAPKARIVAPPMPLCSAEYTAFASAGSFRSLMTFHSSFTAALNVPIVEIPRTCIIDTSWGIAAMSTPEIIRKLKDELDKGIATEVQTIYLL